MSRADRVAVALFAVFCYAGSVYLAHETGRLAGHGEVYRAETYALECAAHHGFVSSVDMKCVLPAVQP